MPPIFSYINLYGCHVTLTNWWLCHYKMMLFILGIVCAQSSFWLAINMATTPLIVSLVSFYMFLNILYLTHLLAFVANNYFSIVVYSCLMILTIFMFRNVFQIDVVSDTFQSLWTNTREEQGQIIFSHSFSEFSAYLVD